MATPLTSLAAAKDGVGDVMDKNTKDFHQLAAAAVDLTSVHGASGTGILSVIRSVRNWDLETRQSYLYRLALPSTSPTTTTTHSTDAALLLLPPVPLDKSVKIYLPSPSGEMTFVVKTLESEKEDGGKPASTVVEIWKGAALLRHVSIDNDTHHGKIIQDPTGFGQPSWSPNERYILYSAERLSSKTTPFWSSKSTIGTDGTDIFVKGGRNVLGQGQQESWGERYSTQSPILDLYILDTRTGKLGKIHNVPTRYDSLDDGTKDESSTTAEGSFTLGQAVWHPTGDRIAYTVWDARQPKRLGMIYCRNRVSRIYESSVSSLLETLAKESDDDNNESDGKEQTGAGGKAYKDDETNKDFWCISGDLGNLHYSRSPRYVAGSLVFLASDRPFASHDGCMGLYRWLEERRLVETVVPVVDHPWTDRGGAITVFGMGFPGLFLSQLPLAPSVGNNFIVTSTLWGSIQRIIRVDLSTGNIDLIEVPALSELSSQSVIASTTNGDLVVAEDACDKPTNLWVIQNPELVQDSGPAGKIIAKAHRIAEFPPIAATTFSPVTPYTNFSFDTHILSMIPPAIDGSTNDPIQSILLIPKTKQDRKLPFVVIPHGGPHSCSTSFFSPGVAYMASKYAVLLPNYRGSTGFGQAPLTSLLSRIGAVDVEDVMACTKQVLETFPNDIDPNRVGVCGGSHGGFLAAHCTSQYPDFFKAAAMRNPVTNIASMFTATDITDWTLGEVLGEYDQNQFRGPTADQIVKMYEKSPVSRVDAVKTPTLIALGMVDLRVPPSQGLEWYHSLRSMGVPTRLLKYPNDCHALDQAATEADHWLHIGDWFDRYLLD